MKGEKNHVQRLIYSPPLSWRSAAKFHFQPFGVAPSRCATVPEMRPLMTFKERMNQWKRSE